MTLRAPAQSSFLRRPLFGLQTNFLPCWTVAELCFEPLDLCLFTQYLIFGLADFPTAVKGSAAQHRQAQDQSGRDGPQHHPTDPL